MDRPLPRAVSAYRMDLPLLRKLLEAQPYIARFTTVSSSQIFDQEVSGGGRALGVKALRNGITEGAEIGLGLSATRPSPPQLDLPERLRLRHEYDLTQFRFLRGYYRAGSKLC